jgi:methylmalonyl-CoA mutase cobalamin-binding domain/chain
MDAETLGANLERSSIALGQRGLLERFVSPLARRIGELWENGTMTAAHEHFASNVLRQFLLRGSRAYSAGVNAPLLVVTTPTGQLHELGAAIVAASARDLGWRVLYLGANLPAADIAHAAIQNSARVVALSIVYPGDDDSLPGELALLRRLVPAGIDIIAGGAAAPAYRAVMDAAGIIQLENLDAFTGTLTGLRARLTR